MQKLNNFIREKITYSDFYIDKMLLVHVEVARSISIVMGRSKVAPS